MLVTMTQGQQKEQERIGPKQEEEECSGGDKCGCGTLEDVGDLCFELICSHLEDIRDLSRLARASKSMYLYVRGLPPNNARKAWNAPVPELPHDLRVQDVSYWCLQGLRWSIDNIAQLGFSTDPLVVADASSEACDAEEVKVKDAGQQVPNESMTGMDASETSAVVSNYTRYRLKIRWNKAAPLPFSHLPLLGCVHTLDLTKCSIIEPADGTLLTARDDDDALLSVPELRKGHRRYQMDPKFAADFVFEGLSQTVRRFMKSYALGDAQNADGLLREASEDMNRDRSRRQHEQRMDSEAREEERPMPFQDGADCPNTANTAADAVPATHQAFISGDESATTTPISPLPASTMSMIANSPPTDEVPSLSRCASSYPRNPANVLFPNLHTIILTAVKYPFDLAVFAQIHTVDLTYCEWVTNVSPLAHVHTLTLEHCDNIIPETLPSLSSVHTLSLRGCKAVEDDFGLASVHTLDLSECMYIRSVERLGRVHTLLLSGSNVSEVTMLGRVRHLDLSQCRLVGDVTGLGNVHTLDLSNCEWLENVTPLTNVHTLNLSRTEVEDVSCLGNTHTLDVSYCSNLEDVSALAHVYSLNLSACEYLSDVSSLTHVHRLNLTRCYNVTDVSALGSVHDLCLAYCFKISDVSSLHSVHTLDLDHCLAVTDVSGLIRVHTLNVTSCSALPASNAAKLLDYYPAVYTVRGLHTLT